MRSTILVTLTFFIAVSYNYFCSAQGLHDADTLMRQAQQEYAAGLFARAEGDFLQITHANPSNVYAQMYLGHALFMQKKYAAAVIPYEKVRKLDASDNVLSSNEKRVLVDQLAMAYGIADDLKKSRTLLRDAIQQDPQYPLNYYNLACAYAEEGDKPEMLTNLSLAFERREHALEGEKMPDPRLDASFEKYLQDRDFRKLMAKIDKK
jgi:predicted Zn-dependent protease